MSQAFIMNWLTSVEGTWQETSREAARRYQEIAEQIQNGYPTALSWKYESTSAAQ